MRQVIHLRSRFTEFVGKMEEDRTWEIERPDYYHGWPIYSQAFICPQCLWCWATVGEPPYQTIGVACVWHPECRHVILRPVPGSLLDNSTFTIGPDLDLLAAMPLELKQREFDLHVAQAEREDSHEYGSTHIPLPGTELASGSECPAGGPGGDGEDLRDWDTG